MPAGNLLQLPHPNKSVGLEREDRPPRDAGDNGVRQATISSNARLDEWARFKTYLWARMDHGVLRGFGHPLAHYTREQRDLIERGRIYG